MSAVATAIVGGAVISGYFASQSADAQSGAVAAGAASAAGATIQSTAMQIAEIQRQFDYQQQILLPQIQTQYNAQGAFSDLMGIGGPSPAQSQVGIDPAFQTEKSLSVGNNYLNPAPPGYAYRGGNNSGGGGGGGGSPGGGADSSGPDGGPGTGVGNGPGGNGGEGGGGDFYNNVTIPNQNGSVGNIASQQAVAPTPTSRPPLPLYPTSGATQFQRGPNGEFMDPNLDPRRISDINTYGDTVRDNLMAGTSAEDDPFRNYIDSNQISASAPGQDLQVARARDVTMMDARGGDRLAEGAAGTNVYGESFEASPGYAFAREEMDRASDRVRSAGGNYGGRAMIEAQRRAKGLADQEYYNWAAGRTTDLARLGGAEAADAERFDNMSRFDISRGDTALSQYESKRISDVGRGDTAYQDYLRRREGDASRLDSAARQEDSLIASDIARTDQGYYNYMANLGQVAGFGGGPAATAVNASQAAGEGTANAYAQQGGQLSNIATNAATNQANISGAEYANYNNAIQSGIGNYITYQNSQPTRRPPIS